MSRSSDNPDVPLRLAAWDHIQRLILNRGHLDRR